MFKTNSKTKNKQRNKNPESTDESISLKQKDCLCSLRRPKIRHKAKVSNCLWNALFCRGPAGSFVLHCGSLHEVLFSSVLCIGYYLAMGNPLEYPSWFKTLSLPHFSQYDVSDGIHGCSSFSGKSLSRMVVDNHHCLPMVDKW